MTQDRPRPASSSRWAIFQYSCRTLLLMMVVVSVFFAWWSDREKLTKKVERLDDELTMLQAALGDSVWEDESSRIREFFPASAGYFTVLKSYRRSYRGIGVINSETAAWAISDEAVRDMLHPLFNSQKAWLSKNLKDNRDWQEFLAVHPDPNASPYDFDDPPLAIVGGRPKLDSQTEAKTRASGDAAAKVAAPKFPVAKLIPVALAMLRDGDSKVRLATMQHVEQLESRFAEFVPTLIGVLDDKEVNTRLFAVVCLLRMGATAKQALPRLKKLMNSSEDIDAVLVASAVMQIDPKIDVVPRLTELLTSKSELTPPVAATLLMQLGPEKAAPAVPTLIAMLNYKRAEMRVMAAAAVAELTPRDEAIDMLTEFVQKEKDQAVKMAIARIVLRLKAGVKSPHSPSGGVGASGVAYY